MSKVDVVVIGSGIIGLCVAEALLARGKSVIVLEKLPENDNGSSFGNGGLIVPSHFVPLAAPGMIATGLKMMPNRESPFGLRNPLSPRVLKWVAQFMAASNAAKASKAGPVLRDLNLQSKAAYEDLKNKLDIDFGYGSKGMLMLSKTVAGFDAEAHLSKDANALGLTAEVLSAAEVTKLDPSIEMSVAGGVYFKDDAHLTPNAFMHGLRDRIKKLGGEFRYSQPIEKLERAGADIGDVAGIHADEYVLAAGVWSTELAKTAGFDIPQLAGKGYGVTVTDAPATPTIPSILTEARVAVTPMQNGVRFVGTMELGLPDSSINENRVKGVQKSIASYYPQYADTPWSKYPVWMGLRPCSPDGMPYVGKAAQFSNLYIATGHAMMGMSLGPITGRIIADLITKQPLSLDISSLDPNRYA